MKQNKKIIIIIFIALLFGILGFFTIRVYASGSLSSERAIEEDDEKTLVRMVTSLSKGADSNNNLNTNILKSFFDKYVGTDEVDVKAAIGDLINVQFNESGNLYEIDIFKGLIDFGQVDRYIIKYDANGGNYLPYMQTAELGEQIKLTEMRPTKLGHTFLGWSISSTATMAEYASGDMYTVNGNVTLYAVWEQEVVETYTITFNANGGTGAPSPQTAPKGQNIIISNQIPTKEGYTFLGWHTSSSATTPQYTAGGTYKGSSDITLYAVWKQKIVETYKITFNANGGSGGPTEISVNVGESINLPISTPTKEGFEFLGWDTSSSATSATYSAGQSITPSSNMTLYAIWKQRYTITYNANGGNGAPTQTSVLSGQDAILSATEPTRDGYTFLGWSKDQNAITATYTAGGTIPAADITADVTIYAIWQQLVQYTITFDACAGSFSSGETTKTITVTQGSSATAITDTPTSSTYPTYYKFKGWATTRPSYAGTGTVVYETGAEIPASAITGNMTLYAVYKY